MAEYLTMGGFMEAALVILAICWAWNLVYTGITNARKERKHAEEPILRVKDEVSQLKGRLEEVERRITSHEQTMVDLKNGQNVLCHGIQALLEHEMHNGNGDEMIAASTAISEWLRARR